MTEAQRARVRPAEGGAECEGVEQTRNIMKLYETIAELTNNFTEYGESLYNITVMGEPSPRAPWGWQLEGTT